MTIRVAAEGAAYLVDDSFTPPRVVGIRQADGTESYFSLRSSAPAGVFGEYQSVTVLDDAKVALTTNNAANVASLPLTAGEWLVHGNIRFVSGVGTLPTTLLGWVDTVSATPPTEPNAGAYFRYGVAFPAGVSQSFPVGMKRLVLTQTTTVYLSAFGTFTVSTLEAYGFLGALRIG